MSPPSSSCSNSSPKASEDGPEIIELDKPNAPSDTQEPATTKRPSPTSRKRKHDIVELLECPVCLETPRGGPVMTCSNGHVVCAACRPKTPACPVCRIPLTPCRNLIAERLLEDALSDRVVPCRLAGSGCGFRSLLPRMLLHESICVYRAVPCPARHRGACAWTGPLHMLVKHVVKERCVQIVKMHPEKRTYSSVIGNFNQEDMTVFGRASMTHWKPVLLVSTDHMRYFAYLVMYRTQKGEWIVYVRGYAAREALDRVRVKVTVRSAPNSNADEKDRSNTGWSFEGDIVSHEVSEADVMESGMFLLLGDLQVKRLCEDKTLFEYVVEIVERTSATDASAAA